MSHTESHESHFKSHESFGFAAHYLGVKFVSWIWTFPGWRLLRTWHYFMLYHFLSLNGNSSTEQSPPTTRGPGSTGIRHCVRRPHAQRPGSGAASQPRAAAHRRGVRRHRGRSSAVTKESPGGEELRLDQ